MTTLELILTIIQLISGLAVTVIVPVSYTHLTLLTILRV